MPEIIFIINVMVIILKFIFFPCIIGRIYVDNIYFASVCVRKLRQCSEIITLDYEVIWSIGII